MKTKKREFTENVLEFNGIGTVNAIWTLADMLYADATKRNEAETEAACAIHDALDRYDKLLRKRLRKEFKIKRKSKSAV